MACVRRPFRLVQAFLVSALMMFAGAALAREPPEQDPPPAVGDAATTTTDATAHGEPALEPSTRLASEDVGREEPVSIEAVFDGGKRSVEHCRKRVARDYGTQQGRLRLAVTIGTEGRVERVDVLENGASDVLGRCIQGLVESWTFPSQWRPVTVERLWIFG